MDATQDAIEEQIAAEMNRWRKRVNAPNPERRREAEEKQELLQKAKEILEDPQAREAYDKKLRGQQNNSNDTQQEEPNDRNQANIEELDRRFKFFESEKSYQEAAAVAREVTKIDPNNASAWYNVAFMNYLSNKYADARFEINEAISRDPGNAHYYYMASHIYFVSDDIDHRTSRREQRAYIDKALEIAPDVPLYNTISAQLFYNEGNYQTAIDILERLQANKKLDRNDEPLLALAYVDKVKDNYMTAVELRNGNLEYYFTSKAEIHMAKDVLQNASRYAHTAQSKRAITEAISLADRTLKSEYNFKFLIVAIIGAFWFLTALESFSIIQLAISGAIVYFSWNKFRIPNVVRNQKFIKTLQKN